MIAALLAALVVQFHTLALDGPARRDFRGNTIRCRHPRVYPDSHAPDGMRYEKCRVNTCPPCFMEKILTTLNAIRLYPLAQSGIATLLDDHMDVLAGAKLLRTGVNAAFRFVKDETGIMVPRASVVEISEANRVHLHVLTRGPEVPSELFAQGLERAGLGYGALQPVIATEAITDYVYKTALPTAGEAFIADLASVQEFLSLNGGRVISTRGDFWVDLDGTVLDSALEARKAAFRAFVIRTRHRTN